MEKIGIISGKGGVGKSTFAKYISLDLAKEEKVLLIDSDFGFRTLDLMLNAEDSIYDLYDFANNSDDDMCINNIEDNENLDFICASQSKKVSDIDIDILKEKFENLSSDYKYILVDIPRDEESIVFWGEILDKFIVLTEDNPVSLRLTDKIMYIFLKNKIKKDILVVFNKIKNHKEFNLEEKYEIFMGPRVKIISKVPYFEELDLENLDEFKLFINDISKVLKGEEIVLREKLERDDKGFLKKIFGK